MGLSGRRANSNPDGARREEPARNGAAMKQTTCPGRKEEKHRAVAAPAWPSLRALYRPERRRASDHHLLADAPRGGGDRGSLGTPPGLRHRGGHRAGLVHHRVERDRCLPAGVGSIHSRTTGPLVLSAIA
jgi:hypothetical protein